jgi:prepilin-type N-terminal cleavage/methylation domain-containing protein
MRIQCTQKSETGFTLVEVVMAIALLGVMASGIFGSFRYGFFTLQLARENLRATQILLEKVETLRLYSWDQVNTTNFIPANLPPECYDPQAPTGARGTIYNGTVTVAPCTNGSSYSANLRLVTVTLNWTNRDIPHTRSLTTYIAKDGLQNYVY